MAKLRVLHIIGSFHQGGSEQQALQLVRSLHEEGGYRVYLACLDREGVLRSTAETLGFEEIPEFRLNSFYDANTIRQLRNCSRYIREKDIKMVQTHDFYTNVFGMTAAALARVPARIAAKRETGMRSRSQEFVERRSYNLAHVIVVNADAVRDKLVKERVPTGKITTIYNGVDIAKFDPTSKLPKRAVLKSFGLPDNEAIHFVTILANLRNSVKNHEMFLKAAQIVKREVSNTNFIIAGEGDLIGAAKSLAFELGIGNQTHFIGRCERIAELLSITSVCALTSRSEGLANAILEYMAAARPVVATNVGGGREAVVQHETGYLVPSNDHESMAERIIELLQDRSKARELGVNGRKTVIEKFSLEKQLERTLELYRRLIQI